MSTNQPVKAEENSPSQPPATPAPAPATPAPAAPYSWPTTQIPIDPALQQQSQPGTSGVAQATPTYHYNAFQHYQAYYQQYSSAAGVPAPTTAVAQPRTVTAPTVAATTTSSTTAGGVDTSDLATLNDALGSTGVDLRAEEESLQRTSDHHLTYRSYEDRTRKQPPKPSFDTRILGTTMRTIGTTHKVTHIPEDSVNYLALALRIRLQELLTSMISAAKHRTDTQFDRPASLYEDGSAMWSILIQRDVAKQLAAIEKVEREEELRIRKERKERQEMAAAHAAALAAQAAGNNALVSGDGFDEDGGARKKRKKEGPGVTARNMSEDVRKKMSNAVASQAAGLGGRYSWMTAANATAANTTPVKKDKPATTSTPATTTTATSSTPAMTTTPVTTTTTSSWARPYVATKKTPTTQEPAEEDTRLPITLRDAMFVIRNERGHGGGRGAARGWT